MTIMAYSRHSTIIGDVPAKFWSLAGDVRRRILKERNSYLSSWYVFVLATASFKKNEQLFAVRFRRNDEGLDVSHETEYHYLDLKRIVEQDLWDTVPGWDQVRDERDQDNLKASVTTMLEDFEKNWERTRGKRK